MHCKSNNCYKKNESEFSVVTFILMLKCLSLLQGVHLDEVLAPSPAADAENALFNSHMCTRAPRSAPAQLHGNLMSLNCPGSASPTAKTMKSASDYQISGDLQQKCTLQGSSKSGATGNFASIRASKSESPQPMYSSTSFSNCVQTKREATRLSSTASTCSTSSPPETPDSKVQFDFGSDSEEDASSTPKGASKKILPLNRESKSKGRFKRILRPLRRSQSAGCSQDVPAHALFLRHEGDRKALPVSRPTILIV